MKTQIQFNTFNFHSNSVRVIKDPNQEIWFCGTDVCDVLGYANSRKALQDHCKLSGVTKRYISHPSGRKEAIFINEPNLYRLIIKSRKPEAERFEAWVFEEVLPQIRKTGKYSLEQKQLALPEPEPLYHFTFDSKAIHQLVWLLYSHGQMNWLLGRLAQPLEAIGSSFAPRVYGNHTEYKRHYKECLPIIHKMLEPLKQQQPGEFKQLMTRLNNF